METPPSIPTPPPAFSQAPAMPLYARVLNIFAVPSAVFEDLKLARVCLSNWLLPLILLALVGGAAGWIRMAQPDIQKIRETERQKIDEGVKTGKITATQAEQAKKLADVLFHPVVSRVLVVGGAALVGMLQVFGWAFALWLLGIIFLKVRLRFMKLAEVAGLAGLIGVLGTVVVLLVHVNFSNFADSPQMALTAEFDPKNPMNLLGNAFNFWQLAILATGLSRLAAVPFARAGFAILSFWLVAMSGIIMLFYVFKV